MSNTNKIKTCPVENCRAKGGPANCRYHAGVLLYYADKARALPANQREGSVELAEWQDYSEKMVKWYKNNKKRAAKKDIPVYDKDTPISSDEDVKTLYDAISQSIDNPKEYQELTGATQVIPSGENTISSVLKEKFNEQQLREIRLGLQNGVDVSFYANPKLSSLEMWQIRRDLEQGVDVSIYADPQKYDWEQRKQIREGLLKEDVDVSIYADPKYNCEQMREIREGLEEGINVSIYADPKFNCWQMREIHDGLIAGVNVSIYADPKFDSDQMKEIRFGLEHRLVDNIDVLLYANPKFDHFQMIIILARLNNGVKYAEKKFNTEQIQQLRKGLKNGINASKYADPKFNAEQMQQIRYGLEHDIDVSSYADPKYSWEQMQKIRKSLED